ncbi:MAG: hypothetical protein ACOY3J_07470 [Bacillota bacterium]|uniref:Helix-turn-helix domain-containing protein n=1 Tax=Thermanaerosceptrum fracticalcis TaxID=1712410 RepID=A0A7G6E195_THEFR|nr:hypothetical protein [Thermanaerosceptrum fracticalcis]QNB45849.1 hypothetical protein BR63_05680 [Thermanaerosceptrum fracticalcis]
MGSKNKVDDKTIEKIKALLATGKAKNAVARELGISWATVDKYSQENADEIEDLREQKRREFINEAWEDIKAAMFLGRQKIRLATVTLENFQQTIDKLVELLEKNEETNGKDIIELIKAISSVTSIPLSHISTYFGTLYDKQALANGEPTNNLGGTLKVELDGDLDKWAQ